MALNKTIIATIVASIFIFGTIPGVSGADRATFILYGVAMTGIGMLTLTGNNVAMDSFGPIAVLDLNPERSPEWLFPRGG